MKRFVFNKGQASKMDKPGYGVKPKMGRAWWYWLPRVTWNKGFPWYHNCADISVYFLCYWLSFGIWTWEKPGEALTAVQDK